MVGRISEVQSRRWTVEVRPINSVRAGVRVVRVNPFPIPKVILV